MRYFLVLLLISLSALAQRVGDNTALVIIDMQPYFVTRGGHDQDPANVEKVKKIIEEQSKLIEEAKKQDIPIILIEYKNYGPTNIDLMRAVGDYQNVKTIAKSSDGMFQSWNDNKKELTDYLNSNEIGNLIITGANGGACVKSSITSALAENYSVVAFSKAIADFNYKEFIYPYDDQYQLTYNCTGCTFKELDDLASVSLEITSLKNKVVKPNPAVDNSGRQIQKDNSTPEKPKTQQQPETTHQ